MNPKQNFRGPSSIEAASADLELNEKTKAVAHGVKGKDNAGGKAEPAVRRKLVDKEQEDTVQRKENGAAASSVSQGFQSAVDGTKGQGAKLDNSTENFMSSQFGVDFSGVKIHNNSKAHQMANEINAKAFTVGNDIYFNKGEYQPTSPKGKKLLAHELTHTVQQGGGVQKMVQPDLYRTRIRHSGSVNLGPGISLSWTGRRVSITANMEVYGPSASAAVASTIQSDISGVWNASFSDGYSVSASISVTYRPDGQDEASDRTQIWVGPLAGPSNVRRSWIVFSRYMTLADTDLTWTPAHEFGHLLALPDHYSETFLSKLGNPFGLERTTSVDDGWDGNIMAVDRGVLESKNVEELLNIHASEIVTFVEDAVDEVTREIGNIESGLRRGILPF